MYNVHLPNVQRTLHPHIYRVSNKNNYRRSEVDVPVLKKREVTEIVKRCCAGWTEDANGDCLTRKLYLLLLHNVSKYENVVRTMWQCFCL